MARDWLRDNEGSGGEERKALEIMMNRDRRDDGLVKEGRTLSRSPAPTSIKYLTPAERQHQKVQPSATATNVSLVYVSRILNCHSTINITRH